MMDPQQNEVPGRGKSKEQGRRGHSKLHGSYEPTPSVIVCKVATRKGYDRRGKEIGKTYDS